MTASPQLLSPSQAGALSKPALKIALSIFIIEILVHVHANANYSFSPSRNMYTVVNV
jgi:hypothetical protein